MSPTITAQLAEFATSLTHASLPRSAREYARNLLLDSVACALSADFGDETRVFTDFARAAGGPGESTVIGSGERLSLLGATLLNGFLITSTTICDAYVPAHVHITPEVVPPALAVAERDGLDGKSLLTAVAAGAEVAVRLSAGINYSVAGPRGWHMPGIVGPFGGAAAIGWLRGFSPLQMRNALGLALSQSGGTWASWGTPTVKFHQSRGAASGLMAGLLAEQGFKTACDSVGHAETGLLSAFSDGGNPEAIVSELGSRFELEKISLRLWPGGTPLQPSLTAAFELLARHDPAFDQMEQVRIEIAPAVYEAHARFVEPKGVFEALLSYPFVLACALRDRKFWLTSVGASKLADPEIRSFMSQRVKLVANPELSPAKSRVSITMATGEVLSAQVDGAKGTSSNPATLEDLCTKYHDCVSGRLSPSQAAELLDLLVRVDQLDDLDRLFELLGSTRAQRQ